MKPKRAGESVRAAGMLLMSDIDGKKSFLLMRHANRWDLPKGHCDGDETFKATAFRETEEETGITANEIEMDPDFQFDLHYPVTYQRHGDQVFQKHVRYFLARLSSQPKIHVTEHESYRWFDWSPPHKIQEQTIDGLLNAVARHLDQGLNTEP